MTDITVTRKVVFTDYDCQDDIRPAVTLATNHDGKPYAFVELTRGDRKTGVFVEYHQPDMLRALAAVLTAAADEWEKNQ